MDRIGYLLKVSQKSLFDKETKQKLFSSKHRNPFITLPIMSRKSSANTTGPLSMGFPDPLKTRPVKQ